MAYSKERIKGTKIIGIFQSKSRKTCTELNLSVYHGLSQAKRLRGARLRGGRGESWHFQGSSRAGSGARGTSRGRTSRPAQSPGGGQARRTRPGCLRCITVGCRSVWKTQRAKRQRVRRPPGRHPRRLHQVGARARAGWGFGEFGVHGVAGWGGLGRGNGCPPGIPWGRGGSGIPWGVAPQHGLAMGNPRKLLHPVPRGVPQGHEGHVRLEAQSTL